MDSRGMHPEESPSPQLEPGPWLAVPKAKTCPMACVSNVARSAGEGSAILAGPPLGSTIARVRFSGERATSDSDGDSGGKSDDIGGKEEDEGPTVGRAERCVAPVGVAVGTIDGAAVEGEAVGRAVGGPCAVLGAAVLRTESDAAAVGVGAWV